MTKTTSGETSLLADFLEVPDECIGLLSSVEITSDKASTACGDTGT